MTDKKKDSDSSDKGPRFTAGDDLTGVKKVAHDLMMTNELNDGYGAYKLSHANTKESGLSFGGNQVDMSKRPEARDKFVDILNNAKDSKGKNIFSEDDVKNIAGNKLKNLKTTDKTPEQVFGKNLPNINKALSSPYGIKALNEMYLRNMDADFTKIDRAINLVHNSAAKEFYSSDFGKSILFDYNNQFNINDDGALLQKFIDGAYNKTPKKIFGTEKCITAPTDNFTLKDHIDYLHSTEQYYKYSSSVDNRLAKTLNTLKEYNLTENKPFLKLSEFNVDNNFTSLADNDINFSDYDLSDMNSPYFKNVVDNDYYEYQDYNQDYIRLEDTLFDISSLDYASYSPSNPLNYDFVLYSPYTGFDFISLNEPSSSMFNDASFLSGGPIFSTENYISLPTHITPLVSPNITNNYASSFNTGFWFFSNYPHKPDENVDKKEHLFKKVIAKEDIADHNIAILPEYSEIDSLVPSFILEDPLRGFIQNEIQLGL